jgi:acetyl/propionyl-CoA carboxylase alpha subunit
VHLNGWAIEARVLAEDPEAGFLPATGEIAHLQMTGGPGVRVDSALYIGAPVTADYDSLIAKVIAWGEDRNHAIQRLRRALAEFDIAGVPTDIKFLLQILESSSFLAGRADTTYLDTFHPPESEGEDVDERDLAMVAAMITHQARRKAESGVYHNGNEKLWRQTAWREQMRRSS